MGTEHWQWCFPQEMKAAFEEEAADTGNPQLLVTAAVAAHKESIDSAYQIGVIAQWVQF